MDKLKALALELSKLVDDQVSEKAASYQANLKINTQTKEVVLNANREALIYFANYLVHLSLSETEGSHQTFDQANIFDSKDERFTIVLRTKW